MARTGKGPQFVRYLGPVLTALKELGGSGRPSEVVDIVARLTNVSDSERQESLQSGALRFDNQVAFARQYLVWAGYLDASKRGVWTLTQKGIASRGLSDPEALALFKEQHALHSFARKKPRSGQECDEDADETIESRDDYRDQFLAILRNLSPGGFERFCQRLLRESGFEKVQVTGRSGDGGIDGNGIVKVNPFVSFRVLFQCKRYKGAVGAGQIRDFRGAMGGRADLGIILTTGSFTRDAQVEAVRDGVKEIELVNADKLLNLCEELQLGLRARKTYEVDSVFFDQFVETGKPDDDGNSPVGPRQPKSRSSLRTPHILGN
jgi:restriction system protein